MNKKQNSMGMKMFYVYVVLALFISGFVFIKTDKYFEDSNFTSYKNVDTYNMGWLDKEGNSINIPGDYQIEAGEDFYIHMTVTEEIKNGSYLLFRTDHTFVKAFINDTQVYKFGDKSQIPFGKTPGSGWQLISLEGISVGDTITIYTNCPYDKYSGLLRDIYIGSKSELISYIFWNGLFMTVLTLIPTLIGVFIMIIPPIFFRRYSISKFINIGISFVIISIWSFTEARTWQIIFINPYFMQMINFLTFAVMVPSILLSVYTMGLVKSYKLYNRIMIIDMAAALSAVILQVTNIADFFDTLVIIHIMIALNAVIFATDFIRRAKGGKGFTVWISALLYTIIGASALLDLMDFYVWDTFGNGFFTRIEILILLLASGLLSMRRALTIHNENIEKLTYEKMAYTDALTGFRNKRGFDEDIEKIEKNSVEVAILYMDMNGLKVVNDTKGHNYGDKAIKTVSKELSSIVDQNTTCYRLGGDEFCVLSSMKTGEELLSQCNRINNNLRQYTEEYGYSIDISFGMSEYKPGGGKSMQACIIEADKKMYLHKKQSKET